MAKLKEIVTKAVIGKAKKCSKEELIIETDTPVDTVLGCWVINHNFNGQNNNGKVNIEGNFDINVWYSYDNNTKTNVLVRNFFYTENINVKLRSEETAESEIIVRSLKAPSVSDVVVEANSIKLTAEKELAVEIVGDMKIRVNAEEDFDDYEEDVEIKDVKINDNYLSGVN